MTRASEPEVGRAPPSARQIARGRGVRLGSLWGIEVAADWSVLIIFTLITLSLGLGLFPNWHPDWSAGVVWTTALAAALLFFASLFAHELSHAIVGRRAGMQVDRITLFVFGGMAHLESEPPTWRSELAMAAVGPLTSLVLGAAFILLAALVAGPVPFDPDDPARSLAQLSPLATLLFWLGPINILLAVFNLVPGFPLDGGRIMRAILWGTTGDLRKATRMASLAGQFFAWVLMATGVLMLFGFAVPIFGRGAVGGLWLMFIGWFLNSAAVASYGQLVVRESLEHVSVAKIMQTQVARVGPETRVQDLAERHMMASGQRVLPIERDGRLLGLVSLSDVRQLDRSDWSSRTAGEIMTPVDALAKVRPGADASEALAELERRNVNQLAVVEGDKLVGLLRREDVIKWLALQDVEARHGAV